MRSRPSSRGPAGAGVDAEALVVACEPFRPQLLGLAVSALHDRAAAEDAVQETYLKLWRTSDRYDPGRSTPRTWIFAIARNSVLDALRRRGARPTLVAGTGEQHEDPAAAAVEAVDRSDSIERLLTGMGLEEALRRLTPEHRQVVVEVHVRGRSCADLAQELHLPASTVRSRLVYAVRSLRLCLEEGGWLQ